jgi:V8-like Glu-specific endopeptidase
MGICESTKKSNNYNKKVTNEDNTIVGAFEIKGIKFTKIEKCICKIIRKTKVGTGFFCEIPEKNIKLLVTNNHILDEIYLEQGNKVSYMISENEKETYNEIDLEKDRFKLTNKIMDFTVIEILKEDNIQDFLEINNEQYDKNNEIYSYQYAGGVKLGFSFGNIIVKKKNLLEYNVGTKAGSSGCPILLMKNSKVIGLHKASYINPNLEKINIGIPIETLINQISYIKCTYEIINDNYTQIINYTDGVEVNKDIESKIKMLNNGKEEKLVFMKKFNKIGMNIIYFIIKKK